MSVLGLALGFKKGRQSDSTTLLLSGCSSNNLQFVFFPLRFQALTCDSEEF